MLTVRSGPFGPRSGPRTVFDRTDIGPDPLGPSVLLSGLLDERHFFFFFLLYLSFFFLFLGCTNFLNERNKVFIYLFIFYLLFFYFSFFLISFFFLLFFSFFFFEISKKQVF